MEAEHFIESETRRLSMQPVFIETAYTKLIIVTNKASIHRLNGKMILKNTLICVVVVLK